MSSSRTKIEIMQKPTTYIFIVYEIRMCILQKKLIGFCEYYHGDEMSTQAFKKRIYKAKVKTYFVLNPSIETQKQVQVTYLN